MSTVEGEVKTVDLSWNYTELSPSEIIIKLDFAAPMNISQFDEPDRLFVLLNLDVLELDQVVLPSNMLLQKTIPL